MDNGVALVRAYLHVNGYFTVTEFPVIEAVQGGGYRSATDLDVLAIRFPGAGRLIVGDAVDSAGHHWAPDPELRCPTDRPDMIIGEVKEGRAELNRGARNANVLRSVLARFGCCSAEHADHIVRSLLRKGQATTTAGHGVRLMAFGAVTGREATNYQPVSLGHVLRFLEQYLSDHWDSLHQAQFKDPAFGFLVMLEKARRHSTRHFPARSEP